MGPRKIFNNHWTLMISLTLHLGCAAFFFAVTALRMQQIEERPGRSYFSLEAASAGAALSNEQPTAVEPADGKDAEQQTTVQNSGLTENPGGGAYWGTSDSSSLASIYSESSLGVKMRYPSGWTFLDQNIKTRLDGVTFLGTPVAGGQIPYIHVKVMEKFLFNPARYKYKSNTDYYEAYYNDPEILESQYSQEVYLKTEKEFDYMIKLIIREKQAFHEFQPVFFAMVKSFSFRQ